MSLNDKQKWLFWKREFVSFYQNQDEYGSDTLTTTLSQKQQNFTFNKHQSWQSKHPTNNQRLYQR